MRLTRMLGALCVAFCAAALALPVRAEPAGQVLTAGGDALVLRGGQILRLYRGAAIESGDQIHTAADSNVLVLFSDSGLVWIRANSDFIIDEYSYAQGRGESAFFSLLKGGMRSVTGLIGRRNRMSYRLRVSAAAIGIRGTDFSVVMCQSDCRDSDGSVAAKGLYGEVIEGRIAVTPFEDRLLEREFGAGEFFHLADERSIPTPLFLPPPFLRSKQDEQTRFMEKTGIAVAPGSPGATPAPGPGLSDAPGTTTTGGVTGTVTGGLTGSVIGVTSPVPISIGSTVSAVTSPILTPIGSAVSAVISPVLTPIGSAVSAVISPVLTPIGSAVSAVTSPVVPAVGPVVSAVTPILTPIAAPVVSAVTPIVAPIAAPAVSVVAPIVAPIAAPVAPALPIGLPVVAPVVPLPVGTPIGPPIGAPAVPPVALPGPITTPTTGLPRLPVLGGH
jgi:FecR protein